MYQKRGQSSIEFIVLFGTIFFIFLMLLIVALHFNKMQTRNKDYLELEDLAHKIRKEFDIASQVQDGYQRSFEIPLKVGIKDYALNVTNRDLSLKTGEYEYSLILPDFVGNLTKGDNIISKQGGVIYVNE